MNDKTNISAEKAKSASFTGHRILPNDCGELKKSLISEIKHLIEKGVVFFRAGGALGFDYAKKKIM